MSKRDRLLASAWPTINFEAMRSNAWADTFSKYHDLKFDDFQQVIYSVIGQYCAHPDGCTLSYIQRSIANAYSIDEKTVSTRIQRLIDEELLEVEKHPTDKRKKLVAPTEQLIALFCKYSERLKSIVNHVREQIARRSDSTTIQDLDPKLYFDILEELEEQKTSDTVVIGNMEKGDADGDRKTGE